jgi:uncharacterized membrane protein
MESPLLEPQRFAPPVAPPRRQRRLDYIDLLRGLLMAHMALDHCSYFFNAGRWADEFAAHQPANPTSLAQFLTRFAGVFVAPGFSFMAGFMVATTSAARQARGETERHITRWLIWRGLALIAAEALMFSLPFGHYRFDVLSCLGVGLLILALLRQLPTKLLLPPTLALLALHPLIDVSRLPRPLALLLYEPGEYGRLLVPHYPVLPWLGILFAGFLVGRAARRAPSPVRLFLGLALISLVLFFVVRLGNGYGNAYHHHGITSLDFWIFAKYPPDLAWLSWSFATLLGLLALLASLDLSRVQAWIRPLLLFARVPFFFYLLHFSLLFGLSMALHKGSLLRTFGLWILLLAVMYGPCRAYAKKKAERPNLLTRLL